MLNSFIEFDVFTDKLQHALVNLAYIYYPTITRVVIKTGIDRWVVADIINDKRPSLADNVLKKIIKKLEYQASNGSDTLKKYDEYNSITNIINFAANGATSLSPVVKELIQRGYFKDLGDRVLYQNPAKANNNKIVLNLNKFSLKFDE